MDNRDYDKTVAVIGAGIMGLATAYYLTQKGYRVTVLEKEKEIGGMAVTFDFSGTEIERFYHFHCTSDYDYFEMLKELGLEERLKWKSTSMGYWFNKTLQPWGNPIALLKFKGLGLMAKIRYGLHAFLSVKRNRYDDLDKIESTGWIKKWVGQEAWDKLWKNLFELKFYEYSDRLSAAWIWSRIRRIGRSRYSMFKEKLGYLEGGSKPLIFGIADYIKRNGGNVFSDKVVNTVVKDENGLYKLTCSDGNEFYCRNVVSTIPLPYISDMFECIDERARNMFSETVNEGVVCVIVKLKKALTENFWLNVNDPSMDIPGTIEYTNLNPLDGEHIVYVPYYMPITNSRFSDSDDVYRSKIRTYFKEINKELSDDDFVDIQVSRYRYAQPICGMEYMKTIPDIKMENERIYIADTSYYYPEDRGISEGIKIARKIASLVEDNE